ncbi:MAG: hypothetical protein ACRD6X_22395 [Pyrinomonadaceae bacterium]
MKTAISLSSEVFDLSERLAKQLKISRSAVFAMGIKRLGEEYDEEDVTSNLNRVYADHKAELDPVLVQMAALSLPKEEW